MRIGFLCTFEPHTAGGILTLGRARGAALNGHEVRVVFQPFKPDAYVRAADPAAKQRERERFDRLAAEGVRVRFARTPFFGGGFVRKILSLPRFLFLDFWRVFTVLYRSELAVIHKPLPLSFFYMTALRIFGFRGTLCCVHSDWEGIGGYADTAYPDRILRKLLVTYCEEKAPYLTDVIWCASRTLYTRFGLAERLRPRRIYLTCGGDEFTGRSARFDGGPRTVIFSGSLKSRFTVDFLVRIVSIVADRFRFVLIGTGPFLEDLRNRLSDRIASGGVVCPGHLDHGAVTGFLTRSHYAMLYLNPDYPETYMEMSRSSTKLFEYLCAGNIVIASDFGEARELLRGSGTGFLAGNTPESFAERLVEADGLPAEELEARSKIAAELFHSRFSHRTQMKQLVDFALLRKQAGRSRVRDKEDGRSAPG